MVRSTFWKRSWSLVGLACLAMTVLLLPAGVRIVRAEDEVPARISVAPGPAITESNPLQGPTVLPIIRAGDGIEALRPGVAGIEVAPGVILLNTTGYNYPALSAELDPAALEFESETP